MAATQKKEKRINKASSNGSARAPRLDPNAKIKVLAKENPKRKGSTAYALFEKLHTGMTVEEAQKKGISTTDLRYNEEHGFISLS